MYIRIYIITIIIIIIILYIYIYIVSFKRGGVEGCINLLHGLCLDLGTFPDLPVT